MSYLGKVEMSAFWPVGPGGLLKRVAARDCLGSQKAIPCLFPLFQNGLETRERVVNYFSRDSLDLAGATRLKIECANHVDQRHALCFSARTRERHGKSSVSRELTALRDGRNERHAERVKCGGRENERGPEIPLLLLAHGWIQADAHDIATLELDAPHHASRPTGLTSPHATRSAGCGAFGSH